MIKDRAKYYKIDYVTQDQDLKGLGLGLGFGTKYRKID